MPCTCVALEGVLLEGFQQGVEIICDEGTYRLLATIISPTQICYRLRTISGTGASHIVIETPCPGEGCPEGFNGVEFTGLSLCAVLDPDSPQVFPGEELCGFKFDFTPSVEPGEFCDFCIAVSTPLEVVQAQFQIRAGGTNIPELGVENCTIPSFSCEPPRGIPLV